MLKLGQGLPENICDHLIRVARLNLRDARRDLRVMLAVAGGNPLQVVEAVDQARAELAAWGLDYCASNRTVYHLDDWRTLCERMVYHATNISRLIDGAS